ncbi:DUF2809 domain-containing protein [Nonlabens mediterrranea]|uniref:DUF2809 domain-containing protein n=1 Tax=Nonlabens mediterrranea TaxID=1419947 RepID=A0ABS0A128_9FLAO|nr:DUF2809 domain-containing protein [Nonlabens mediterrranea]
MKPRSKIQYGILAVILFIIEVIIALYINDSFIRPFLGDVLVIGLIYCTVMAISSYRVITVAIGTLIFSYLVETAQYFQIIEVLGLQEFRWARVIIGTSFSWWDIVCYSIGFIIILFIEKKKILLRE